MRPATSINGPSITYRCCMCVIRTTFNPSHSFRNCTTRSRFISIRKMVFFSSRSTTCAPLEVIVYRYKPFSCVSRYGRHVNGRPVVGTMMMPASAALRIVRIVSSVIRLRPFRQVPSISNASKRIICQFLSLLNLIHFIILPFSSLFRKPFKSHTCENHSFITQSGTSTSSEWSAYSVEKPARLGTNKIPVIFNNRDDWNFKPYCHFLYHLQFPDSNLHSI